MPRFFSEKQRSLLDAILDRVIPAEGAKPSAGQCGTGGYVDSAVAESPELPRLFSDGLTAVEVAAAKLGAPFSELSPEDRDDVLRAVEEEHSAFFISLLRLAYTGYYINPVALEGMGLEGRPPQPKGHVIERGDFSSLEAVAARGQAFRDV